MGYLDDFEDYDDDDIMDLWGIFMVFLFMFIIFSCCGYCCTKKRRGAVLSGEFIWSTILYTAGVDLSYSFLYKIIHTFHHPSTRVLAVGLVRGPKQNEGKCKRLFYDAT